MIILNKTNFLPSTKHKMNEINTKLPSTTIILTLENFKSIVLNIKLSKYVPKQVYVKSRFEYLAQSVDLSYYLEKQT